MARPCPAVGVQDAAKANDDRRAGKRAGRNGRLRYLARFRRNEPLIDPVPMVDSGWQVG